MGVDCLKLLRHPHLPSASTISRNRRYIGNKKGNLGCAPTARVSVPIRRCSRVSCFHPGAGRGRQSTASEVCPALSPIKKAVPHLRQLRQWLSVSLSVWSGSGLTAVNNLQSFLDKSIFFCFRMSPLPHLASIFLEKVHGWIIIFFHRYFYR